MSIYFKNYESSSLFSKANNDFLNEWFSWIVPTEKLKTELPHQLETQSVKPILFQTSTCTFLESIYKFNVCADDVYVVSIPKSGSTWTTTIAWLLTHDLNYRRLETEGRDQLMGDFDMVLNVDNAKKKAQEMLNAGTSLNESEAIDVTWNEIFTSLNSPRVIKSHYPPYFLPKEIWQKGARVIYVVRNPKDTAVSYYHFVRNYFLADITKDDVVNGVINDLTNISPHLDHILNYWKIRHLPNVYFVHYEDLVCDAFATLKKISEFLGQSYSDDRLKELVEYISLKSMKHNKAVNRADELDAMETMIGKKRPEADFKFIRRGKPGGYSDDLNEDQIKKLDDWVRGMEKTTDFRFKI